LKCCSQSGRVGATIKILDSGNFYHFIGGEIINPERYKELSLDGLEIAKQFEKKEAIKNYAEKIKQLI